MGTKEISLTIANIQKGASLKYAIIDIETTGSHASGNSITEIGVCIHDGEKVVEEYQTLLNPGVWIPQYITALTGITNDMIEDAPTFEDVSDKLLELLEDAVFVAHNAQFDYSFIKAEFEAIGIKWQSKRLCTVRLARKAFPAMPSYSLGNVCNWLGLHNEQAHRALSDARAAMQLFEKCIAVMDPTEVSKMITRGAPELFLPAHLDRKEFDAVPQKTGVYFLLNEKGKPIYIGKAKNLKKRIQQHFTVQSEGARMQAFMKEIHHVNFELTGTELIALILEDFEIRQHWPKYNEAQKRRATQHHIIQYKDQKGADRLAMQKSNKINNAVKTFASAYRAKEWMMKMAAEFELDPRMLGLDMFDIHAPLPDIDDHNNRLEAALIQLQEREPSFIIRGEGRHEQEFSAVVVKKGQLRGYGFFEDQIDDEELIRSALRLIPPTETNAAIIRPYAENYASGKLIPLAE